MHFGRSLAGHDQIGAFVAVQVAQRDRVGLATFDEGLAVAHADVVRLLER